MFSRLLERILAPIIDRRIEFTIAEREGRRRSPNTEKTADTNAECVRRAELRRKILAREVLSEGELDELRGMLATWRFLSLPDRLPPDLRRALLRRPPSFEGPAPLV